MFSNPLRLLKLAWDSTKLAGDIIARNKQKALVLAENRKSVNKYRGKEANKQLTKLFEEEKYEEVCRLFVPSFVVDRALDLVQFWWNVWDVYWLFCLFRIFLALSPQRGHVHHDEAFQGLEMLVGDVFGTAVIPGANTSMAVLSPTVNVVVFGPPLYALKLLDSFTLAYLGFTSVTSYTVTAAPRLALLCLSFIVDWCVYQVCILYRHSYNHCLSTLASSAAMLVFATRTLTDSLELVLSSLLLYLVAHCMKRTSETVYLHSMVHDAYEKAGNIREKVVIHKKKKIIPPHDFKHALPISILLAVGIFNRPTFAIYAAVPLFYWFQRGVTSHSFITPFQTFNFRMFSIVPGFVATSLLLVLSDSLHHGDLTLKKLWELDLEWSDWKCNPLQFILRNFVPGNMDKLGSSPHPLHHHLLVNLPILFGPLGLLAVLSAAQFFIEIATNEWRKKPGILTVYALTMFTFVFCLGFLSVFPNQQLRFLLPLTAPIVLMNAHKLRIGQKAKARSRQTLLAAWYLYNIAAALFFNYVHQGGIDEMLWHARSSGRGSSKVNLVFSHAYVPPKYPLMLPSTEDFPILISNMGSEPIEGGLKTELVRTALESRNGNASNFVVIPHLIEGRLSDALRGSVDLKLVAYSFPHVSIESFSELSSSEAWASFCLGIVNFDAWEQYELFKARYHNKGMLDVLGSVSAGLREAVGLFGLSMLRFDLTTDEAKIVELEQQYLNGSVKLGE